MVWNMISRPKQVNIKLPRVFSRETMYGLLGAVLDSEQDCKHARITLDFSSLESIQAGGITVLSNLIEAARKAGAKVSITGIGNSKAGRFLEGAGFTYIYDASANLDPPKTTRQHLPLKLVEYDKSQSYIRNNAVPWMSAALGVEDGALATLQVCLEEIFNNIVDHSTIRVGCAYANFNEQERQIKFCISDFGVGIPANVRKNMEISSDSGAIAMACQQGFTTQTTGRNMGAGLHVLTQNVALRNRGIVIICSAKGIYSCVHDGAKLKKTGRPARGIYPGTMVYMVINASTFVPDEVNEEFLWE